MSASPTGSADRALGPVDAELTGGEVVGILDSLGPQRLGLAAAQRPPDIPPLIAFEAGNRYFRDAAPVAAVLQSWEDRFGATLLAVGFAGISLLAVRPPRTVGTPSRSPPSTGRSATSAAAGGCVTSRRSPINS